MEHFGGPRAGRQGRVRQADGDGRRVRGRGGDVVVDGRVAEAEGRGQGHEAGTIRCHVWTVSVPPAETLEKVMAAAWLLMATVLETPVPLGTVADAVAVGARVGLGVGARVGLPAAVGCWVGGAVGAGVGRCMARCRVEGEIELSFLLYLNVMPMCPDQPVTITQKHITEAERELWHADGRPFNYLDVQVAVPGCHDAYDGVLGQTYQCRYLRDGARFSWSYEQEEAFRLRDGGLFGTSGAFAEDAPCFAAKDAARGGGGNSGGGGGGSKRKHIMDRLKSPGTNGSEDDNARDGLVGTSFG